MVKQVMVLVIAAAAVMPVSQIIAAPKSPKLAQCDGKHRRTANPYGSILPTVDPQTGTSTAAGQKPGETGDRTGVDVFPGKSPIPPMPAKPVGRRDKSVPQVPPISSAQPSRNFESC